MPDAASTDRRREGVILAALAAVQFVNIVDFVIVMPLGPTLMRSLGVGASEFSVIVSAYTIAAGIAGVLLSPLLDRVGRRAAFLTLFAGFLVGTLLCGLVSTYPLLVAARIATGAFGGVIGGVAFAILGDVFPEERRGRATGVLMSAFAMASVAGVPLGLVLGTRFGWQTPFLALAALGLPVFAVAALTLPPLTDHVARGPGGVPLRDKPLRRTVETFVRPDHLAGFALTAVLMLGGFAVVPYISAYLLGNAGVTEAELPLVYVAGGAVTLVGSPLVGRLADKYGKLRAFRFAAPASALVMCGMTVLPRVGVAVAAVAVAMLMLVNTARMVAAMALMVGSVAPERRGGFLSANSAVQHAASGLGALLAGQVVTVADDGRLERFGVVGIAAAVVTLLSLPLAARLRAAGPSAPADPALSLAAAAEATCDAEVSAAALGLSNEIPAPESA